jgi:hypothetical protein
MIRTTGPLRYPIDMPVDLTERGSCALPVRLVDLSRDRCRLWAGFRMTEGRACSIGIAHFATIKGAILWSRSYYAEVRFDAALHPAILAHLVARHPPCVASDIAAHIARLEAIADASDTLLRRA